MRTSRLFVLPIWFMCLTAPLMPPWDPELRNEILNWVSICNPGTPALRGWPILFLCRYSTWMQPIASIEGYKKSMAWKYKPRISRSNVEMQAERGTTNTLACRKYSHSRHSLQVAKSYLPQETTSSARGNSVVRVWSVLCLQSLRPDCKGQAGRKWEGVVPLTYGCIGDCTYLWLAVVSTEKGDLGGSWWVLLTKIRFCMFSKCLCQLGLLHNWLIKIIHKWSQIVNPCKFM